MTVDDRTLDTLTGEVVDLLQTLIRNECVNDGTPESGHETRNADVLRSVIEGPSVEVETLEVLPGRDSIVARLPGTDPHAPALMLMGATPMSSPYPPTAGRSTHLAGNASATRSGAAERSTC